MKGRMSFVPVFRVRSSQEAKELEDLVQKLMEHLEFTLPDDNAQKVRNNEFWVYRDNEQRNITYLEAKEPRKDELVEYFEFSVGKNKKELETQNFRIKTRKDYTEIIIGEDIYRVLNGINKKVV